MKRERIIAEFETVEDAKKVEETVKTGYAESTIETVNHWLAVEEDLASSYDRLAPRQAGRRRGVFEALAKQSRANMAALAELRKTLERLDGDRVQRIKLLAEEGA
jgi:hypothetical protein